MESKGSPPGLLCAKRCQFLGFSGTWQTLGPLPRTCPVEVKAQDLLNGAGGVKATDASLLTDIECKKKGVTK